MKPLFSFLFPLLALSHAWAQELSVPLTDLDLSTATTGFGEISKDRSVSGRTLSIGGREFTKGVGVHAPSRIPVGLDGGEAGFRAFVGPDDGPEGEGSVRFEVIADGETVFDSGVMRSGDQAREVNVNLTGAKIVELRVDDGGDGINSDHANWVDATFTVSGAKPVSKPLWMMSVPHYEGPAGIPSSKPERTLASPNGKVRAEVYVVDNRLWIGVNREGNRFLEPSPIGVIIDGVDLGLKPQITGAKNYEGNETYPWLGNQRTLTNHFNGEQISMTSGGQTWALDLRAYDDGVAWRYQLPGIGARHVDSETTSFVMPEGSTYWTHTDTRAYEGNFKSWQIDGSAPTSPVAMPVTVELPGGGFACYTEADIMGYSGASLGVHGHMMNVLFEDDPSGWEMTGPIASPWRVVIAVEDLNALVNASIVSSVCPPPDPKLFPKGILTDWIKPGRSFWTWGFGQWDTARWERIKGYVDDAARLNCQYYTIDDPWRKPEMGWHRNGKDEWASLKEIATYAATKGVGIAVWEHWQVLRDLTAREEFFANVEKAGAVGVKIDFMESESHDRLEFYRSCLELGAKHHILVNFHGANKPAGEERTWPNGLAREGIRGIEQGAAIAAEHWAALPFTRLVSGPGDFTPTALDEKRLFRTTKALQLATAVVYTSPIEHWADSAEVYLRQPKEVIEFIRTKPTCWDETVVLPGSKIGRIAAFARRSGRQWWIGVVNGTDEDIEFPIALEFLTAGPSPVVFFEDDAAKRPDLKISTRQVDENERIVARLAPGGGFVAVIDASHERSATAAP